MHSFARHIAICVCCTWLSLGVANAQSPGPNDPILPESPDPLPIQPAIQAQPDLHSVPWTNRRKLGFAIKMSSLGGGFEVAAPVTYRTNLRAGFNMFSYSRTFQDGINYDGQLKFKIMEVHTDFFPWAGKFHISPGMLLYLGSPIIANTGVPGGQRFSFEGASCYSDLHSPITGHGKITFNRAAPMITFGWGNLIPRSRHSRFSIPFEFGIAYQGSPRADFHLSGNLCESPGVNCRSIASESAFQRDFQSGQSKINNSLSFFRFYPIVSVGFGYKF